MSGVDDLYAALFGHPALDRAAVLSVAAQEGLGGGIGDNGTSFGPFQLHKGGAYPAAAPQAPADAQQWAWSAEGLEYALDRIDQVAAGLKGKQAITNIVRRFERPADPQGEIERAWASYPDWSLDSAGVAASGLPLSGTQQSLGTAPAAGGQPVAFDPTFGAAGKVAAAVEPIVIRALKLLFGVALIGLGVAGIYKALSSSSTAASAVLDPLKAVPAARTARSATRARTAARAVSEARVQETHTARLKLVKARASTERAKAAELRARVPRKTRAPRSVQLPVDRKPVRAGSPGSSQLAAGDSLPF